MNGILFVIILMILYIIRVESKTQPKRTLVLVFAVFFVFSFALLVSPRGGVLLFG